MKRQTVSNGIGLGIMILAVLMALALSATAGGSAKNASDDVVIRWGDSVVTRADVDLRMKALPPEVQERLKNPKERRQYLESLIQILVAGAEARAVHLDKKKKIALRIEDSVNSILLQEYMNDKISRLPQPTEKQARAYYDQNKKEYMTPVFVRARHILVEAKPDWKPENVTRAAAKAQKIYAEVKAGGKIEVLAEKYSDDPGTKSNGGDLGLFQFEQMVPEFSTPVFKMKKGELSQPFRTPFGFHIVKVEDVLPQKQMDFKKVKDDIIVRLDNQNREKLIMGELERLIKKYNAKIVEPVR